MVLPVRFLDFFGHEVWGAKVLDVIEQAMVDKKVLTPDMGGAASTEEVGDEVVKILSASLKNQV